MKKIFITFILVIFSLKGVAQFDSSIVYKRALMFLIIDEFNFDNYLNGNNIDSLLRTKLKYKFSSSEKYSDITFLSIQSYPHDISYKTPRLDSVVSFLWNSDLKSIIAYNRKNGRIYRLQGFRSNDIYSFIADYYSLHNFKYILKRITKWRFLKAEFAIPDIKMKDYYENFKIGKKAVKYNSYPNPIFISR
jgi:hypothetical protein